MVRQAKDELETTLHDTHNFTTTIIWTKLSRGSEHGGYGILRSERDIVRISCIATASGMDLVCIIQKLLIHHSHIGFQ
jgi:hypothetical protein